MFIKDLINLVNTNGFFDFTIHSFRKSVVFFSKFLVFAFVFMFFLYIPTVVSFSSYFGHQMEKFNSLSVSGNFSVMSPVYFPERDSLLVVDDTGLHNKLKNERFLITKDALKYKFFGQEYLVKGEEFSDILKNQSNFAMLFSAVALLFLPSFIFWAYVFAWLKYFLTILLLASIFFTLFDLTHFRNRWTIFFNISVIAGIVPILLETVSTPFSTNYLFLIVQLVGIDVYLVPLVIHSILIVVFGFVLHYSGGKVGSNS